MSPVILRSPGLRFWPLALAAAVAGVAGGVGLSWWQQAQREAEAAPVVTPGGPGFRPSRWPDGGDPLAPSPKALWGLPPFPDASPRQLVAHARLGAAPLDIAYFATPQPVDDVLAFYREALLLTGRRPVSHRYGEGSGYVAFIEAAPDGGRDEGLVHLVSVVRQGARTLVFLSANQPLALLAPAPQLPPGLVLPPGATPPLVLHLGEPGALRLTVQAWAPGLSPAAALDFYRQVAARNGWAVRPEPDGVGLRLTRKGVQWTVLVQPQDQGAALLSSWDERPGDPALSE